MKARLIALVVVLATGKICWSTSAASDAAPSPSEHSLLLAASQLQKAEGADCGAVHHVAIAHDKCEFVRKHCAKGTYPKTVSFPICNRGHDCARCFVQGPD